MAAVKHEYTVPTKQVKSMDDIMKWEKSDAYQVTSQSRNSGIDSHFVTFRNTLVSFK